MKKLYSSLLLLILCVQLFAQTPFKIANLKTEYSITPLGMDVDKPRFSWQMQSDNAKRGIGQSAYQIQVKDESGKEVWNSGKVSGDVSLGLDYQGLPLQPTTKYTWDLTVWDLEGKMGKASSWFETGLMNPSEAAWSGAKWIGGGDEDLVFYSHYFSVYKIQYALQLDEASKSQKASFVYGANDTRLMDINKNIMGVENGKDESYIRLELDLSAVDGSETGLAKMHIYRVGYTKDDKPNVPIKSLEIPISEINLSNKYHPYEFRIESNFGVINLFLKEYSLTKNEKMGQGPFAGTGVNLNPVGVGNDYISFPMVGDIGFFIEAGQKAKFSNVQVRNFRFPSNALFLKRI